jgi:hypothetical protein
MYTSRNHQLGTIWVDVVGLAVLTGVVMAAAMYLLWCRISKLRMASSPLQAGVFRLAAARGDIHTMACLAAAGVPLEAANDGFTALLAACVHGQTGEQCCQANLTAQVRAGTALVPTTLICVYRGSNLAVRTWGQRACTKERWLARHSAPLRSFKGPHGHCQAAVGVWC